MPKKNIILTKKQLSEVITEIDNSFEYLDDTDSTIQDLGSEITATGKVGDNYDNQKNATSDLFATMRTRQNYWWSRAMGSRPLNSGSITKEEFEKKYLDEGGRRYFGGNSGYVGYSKSRRAVDAEDRGLKNKSQMDISFVNDIKNYVKNETGEDIKITLALVRRELPNINSDEWHHTSKYGNKTEYYSVETIGDYFINQMKLERVEQEKTISSNPSPKYNADYLRKVAQQEQEHKDIEDRIFQKGFILDLDVQPGQKVEHAQFGNGIVKDILDDGRVYVIDFDNLGEKKLLRRFAKLKKIEETKFYKKEELNKIIREDNNQVDIDQYLDSISQQKIQNTINIINQKLRNSEAKYEVLKYILNNINRNNLNGDMKSQLRDIIMF